MHQLHLAARHQAVVVNENLRTQRENSMDITSLIIQLVSGAVGGNIGGAIFKNLSLGTTGNSIVGIIGGPLGAMLLSQLGLGGGAEAGGLGAILSNVAGSGVGGVILMLIIGFIKKAMAR
jgi:uncharacterized membrane protein YeaQ/YmgE (transglycosylase-associated protein family)